MFRLIGTATVPPTITKSFGAPTIPLNGTTSLTISITNPNSTVALTGVSFTDTYPAGLVTASLSGLSSTCGGTTTASASSLALSGGTIAPGTSCTITVNVTGTTAGIKNNSVTITSNEGGTGNTATASITVVAPPQLVKSFGAATIPLNGTTNIEFNITNPNATTPLTGVGFTDALPAGLVVATPNGITGACGGGTILASSGSGTISLANATLAAGAGCTFFVNVTGVSPGVENNTTGPVTSNEGGTGNTASASITVVAPPSIAKSFAPSSIATNGTSTLTFTITNPNDSVALTGVAFTDSLPAGVVVASPTGLTSTCGGTATAAAGSGTISLSGGTIAANASCTVAVNVRGTNAGIATNAVTVTSTNGGTGNTATATLTVLAPP